MPFSHLPAFVVNCFARLASALDPRNRARLPVLLCGLLFATGRRTCTSWFRAAGVTDEFRLAYSVIWSAGRRADWVAVHLLPAIDPLLPGKRLLLGIDDSPTKRYGPHIEGAGIHHNPTPGPAGHQFLYGHNWVSLAALAKHPDWGTIALPLLSELYVRDKDIAKLDPDHQVPFRTKLEMAASLLHWACVWSGHRYQEVWTVVDGGYSKRPFLRAARKEKVVVVGRLPRNAALWSVPVAVPPEERGPGRPPTYGKERISLAKRGGQTRGWQEVQCAQYNQQVRKTIKTFQATWRPAGGLIRVVLVMEEDGWRAYFCTDATATAEEILEAVADRGAHEQTFKDVKEVWGAGEQQVRNLYANVGCFNLCGWMYSLVEAWAWNKEEDELVDRSASPWDNQPRRPSHADRRKALQREVMRAESEAVLAGRPTKQEIRDLTERLLQMAG
jgi:hypothetical protein